MLLAYERNAPVIEALKLRLVFPHALVLKGSVGIARYFGNPPDNKPQTDRPRDAEINLIRRKYRCPEFAITGFAMRWRWRKAKA